MNNTLYTIGHSTLSFEEFANILRSFNIGLVVDVRTIPGSRHNPQFNQTNLEQELTTHAIGYLHLKELGGLRHTTKSSINTGWKNSSFRGFADYMQTGGFQSGLQQLIELLPKNQIAIMCAEAVPWRCHRSLIGDAMLVRGFHVEDIMAEKSSRPHKITPWAIIDGETITYPSLSQSSQEKMPAEPIKEHSPEQS
jgi:uncharacterized protein (DUF488 family)